MERLQQIFISDPEESFPPPSVFQEIAHWIRVHNNIYPNEMLNKTFEELFSIHRQNLLIIVYEEGGFPVGHIALWPILNLEINDKILKLAELGSWIVHPNFRHQRIGELTIGEILIQEILKRFPNLPIIATVKRENSLKGMIKTGGQPLNFYQFPCISSLTCVCLSSSEHFGHPHCIYRSPDGRESENRVVGRDFVDKNGINLNEARQIFCTLVGFNLRDIEQLENNLQSLIFAFEKPCLNSQTFSLIRSFLNKME